jgi:hypothetical protein
MQGCLADHLGNFSFTAYERVQLPRERMEEFISAARVLP